MAEGFNLRAIRKAVQDTLRLAPIARTVAFHAYDPFNDPAGHHQLPAVIISIADDGIKYRGTFGAAGLASVVLQLEVRTQDGPDGEAMMDDLLSAGTGADSSLFDALTADPTFGGVISVGTTLESSSPKRMKNESMTFWSATFKLTCHQPRSAA